MINDQIRSKEVRLIGAEGEQLGVISTKEALAMATEAELDLIAISPTAQPMVCKIMDYGKYKFEINKKEKDAKKKQKNVVLKEIRMSPSIDKHDIDIKINQAIKFLKENCKLRIAVQFKGREMVHRELGNRILKMFIEGLTEYGTSERGPMFEGSSLVVNFDPKKVI